MENWVTGANGERFRVSRYDVGRKTQVVDFRERESYQDPVVADVCVEVLTSDGDVGTLSHLAIDHDPVGFAEDLKKLVGKDGVPVCLSGSLSNSPASVNLLKGLQEALGSEGFLVGGGDSSNDVGGLYSRRAVLQPGKVLVEKRPYKEGAEWEVRELTFPRVGKS